MDCEEPQQLRSKGLLPAIGVGGAVYVITGYISVGTLGLIGIGAGVGYGIGTWLSNQADKRSGHQGTFADAEDLPDAFQGSLAQWQVFLASRAAGQPLSQDTIEEYFTEFAEREPIHARNVRSAQSRLAQAPGQVPGQRRSGVTVVPCEGMSVPNVTPGDV
jgi:hypothetical protein